MIQGDLENLVLGLVWLGLFFSAIYNLDISKEVEIQHTGSTLKNKMIKQVLDNLVDLVLGLFWSVWFFLSHLPISDISNGFLSCKN